MVFTNDGLNNLRNFFGNTGSSSAVAHFHFGTGTSSATQTDSALETYKGFVAIDTKEATSKQIRFDTVLGTSDLTGNDIAEFGLSQLTSSGILSTRDVMTAIQKTTGSEIQASITVRFLGVNDG